ncbi:hypothetical protein BBO99_00002436 [Phytophthora kernoviae]|uniref:Uncharacterized protein n=2 Tax=Phytophthora kernoviae TaxID=325452 RepID=A0A3R7HLK5_9STRA|nr:hypothetical protein G195_004194 [Phytophthora kernoviae 00238/432]KAG2527134.1 hypothetical protein JM16_001907 [Phytophthora kernoviae]KAG2528561.1 hypothetical protein JM18_002009 [Phytophthora kernoviae]RLN31884.1 hypothetical protein BBI17_000506 [Phytophthora kernoviae]RLN83051.1 hypothetical protein BBO99_00002436 [Phytophthora kernoviae]
MMERRRSVPKITGRKLRTPRKFVVTDVPDDELEGLTTGVSVSSSEAWEQREDNNNSNNNNNEDLAASSSSVRKGKTQVKGRFTITDLSPESPEASPEREDLSISMGPTTSLFGSFHRAAASSPSSRSMRAPSPSPSPTRPQNKQTQTVFDHHLEFLEKETFEMKSTLEKMVATNAQWIEALTSAGLVHSQSAPRLSDASFSEPVAPAPVEPSLETKHREMELAFADLQTKYDDMFQKNERMEMKNAMLEIRLQQQINRSSMLRSQLDKLTQYTEKLIGESSEPTLHDYNSDLNSIFGEQSEAHSPTAGELTTDSEYGFNYDAGKSRRQRCRGVDEECMSDTSTEGGSMRKTSSPPPYEQDDDNNRYFSGIELTTADLSSSNVRSKSCAALDSLLDDQVNQLRQSLRSKNLPDIEDHVSAIDSLDSLAVCTSVTNFGDDEYEGPNNQIGHSLPRRNGSKSDVLKHSNSVASLNYSTVSSTSSLAGYGLHLATMAQSKSGYFASMAATSLFGPHPEPYPNASNQQVCVEDDDDTYTVLSPENLRFHDCQSLLQAAEERSLSKPVTRRGFPFTSSKAQRHKSSSLPEANEVSEQASPGLLQRFAVRRR